MSDIWPCLRRMATVSGRAVITCAVAVFLAAALGKFGDLADPSDAAVLGRAGGAHLDRELFGHVYLSHGGCADGSIHDTTVAGTLRLREPFPLPTFVADSCTANVGSSRARRRRQLRLNHSLNLANDAIGTLYELAGRGLVSLCPGAASVLAAENVKNACVELGAPPQDVNAGEGALCALLATSSVYTTDPPDLRSYVKDSVSWPLQGSRPVRFVDAVLEADCFGLIDCELHPLRRPAATAEARVTQGLHHSFSDPALVRSPVVYGDFLQELAGRVMVGFSPVLSDRTLEIFFVVKKNGTYRIVFDVCTLLRHTHLTLILSFANLHPRVIRRAALRRSRLGCYCPARPSVALRCGVVGLGVMLTRFGRLTPEDIWSSKVQRAKSFQNYDVMYSSPDLVVRSQLAS